MPTIPDLPTISDASRMNLLLDRVGVRAPRAVSGTVAGPSMLVFFSALLDRIEGLESALNRLERSVDTLARHAAQVKP